MGRMKSTWIINEALVLHLLWEAVSAMRDNMFSLATNESHDTGLEKMNPLAVWIYEVNTSRCVFTQVIDICCTTGPGGGTAESIFNKIDKVFQKFEII